MMGRAYKGGTVMLSSTVSVGDYRAMEEEEDSVGIAKFVYDRFHERYVAPFRRGYPDPKSSGFCVMASCCLMIEALESFYQGWENTDGKSREAFERFFKRVSQFQVFRKQSDQFYRHVRCGILHQAETTGGWRIRRDGSLFDEKKLVVNADRFLAGLEEYLCDYSSELTSADWSSAVWANLVKKMDSVVANCDRQGNAVDG
jgi:hypothetical protein